MANRRRGEVDIAGRTLVMGTNALCELEDVFDMGIAELAQKLEDPSFLRLTRMRKIIWVGLRQRHPDITEEDAGEVIDAAGGLRAAIEKVGEAFRATFPDAPESAEGQSAARPPLAGTA